MSLKVIPSLNKDDSGVSSTLNLIGQDSNSFRTFQANNCFLIGFLLTLCCGGFQMGHVISCTNNLASTFEAMFECQTSCDKILLKIFREYGEERIRVQRDQSLSDILARVHQHFIRHDDEVFIKIFEFKPAKLEVN